MKIVDEVFKGRPGGNLPLWVRKLAMERGYGDANQPVSLVVTDTDIDAAFTCAAQGNGAACVMAQAGKRLGAEAVYFYRGFAWVDFGVGPIVRFQTARQIYDNVIVPFDHGSREHVVPGVYHLMPPSPANRIGSRREAGKKHRNKYPATSGRSKKIVHQHMERVVMAREATS